MRPNKNDYAPYYERYISLVEGDDINKILNSQSKETQEVINSFSGAMGNFSYAPGKWTVKEVIGHLIDTERVMAYRAMCFARGEKQALPGFDQDDYVEYGNFNARELFDLNYEFRLLRESNILLARGMNEEALQRRGIANNNEITVRALLYVIAGHEKHHLNILMERYKKS
ncbi:MAG: DinB family protein [Ignavibacteriaceae bacterium]|nr:DinB family protein [Ignavibacteriaceae bacterium]